jgi:hypothetical protein
LARTTTALTTFTNVPSYEAQMAHTGLGYDVEGGTRRLWSVSKVPLYGPDGLAWPGAFGTRRDDTGARLGVVGARYKPLQNAQLAEALDLAFMHLPRELRPRVLNAGALGGGVGMGAGDKSGARVYAQLNLPDELSHLLSVPADRDSQTRAMLTLTNTHDGTSSAVIGASCIRIVCRNTWKMAHAESRRSGGFVLRHTVKNVDAYHQQVRKWFKEIASGYAAQGERLRRYATLPLRGQQVDDSVTHALFGEILPADERTPKQQEKVDAVIEMVETRDGQFVPTGDVTAYTVFQALTAYEMHRRPARGELAEQTETRLWRVLTGDEVLPRALSHLDKLIA